MTNSRQHIDPDRVDMVIQLAMAAAARNDFGEQELGPIHLLKYVYLADLAFAEKNHGVTFTGADWRFFKFGPWSASVNERIAPAVRAIEAHERTFSSHKFDGERLRWSLDHDADHVLRKLELALPLPVVSAVKAAVREFAGDTSSLLNHVYMTRPMLHAAPDEQLRFDTAEPEAEPLLATEETSLTEKQKKRRREAMQRLKEELRGRPRRQFAPVMPPPVYDDVFAAGVRALDADAGEPIEATEGELTFDPAIWKSRGRHEPGPP